MLRLRPGVGIFACGICVLSILALGINRNVLYLSMLFACFVLLSAAIRGPIGMLAALGGLVFLGGLVVETPGLKFVDPAPYEQAREAPFARIPAGQEWVYTFRIVDLDQHTRECGPLSKALVVDGLDLANLEIEARGVGPTGSIEHLKKYGLDHVRLTMTVEDGKEVTVGLRSPSDLRPRIHTGPEGYGRSMFGDAVWLEFVNDRCSVLYHAHRRVVPGSP
jgi:hypothetical protein